LSVERLGGKCLLNFCAGGETLLAEGVLPVLLALLKEGHYVMVVTNGTLTKRFEAIAQFPSDVLKRLFFKFSFHYLELRRLGWMDVFFENIERMRAVGCSFTVEITPSDELIPYIGEVQELCMKRLGVLCHVTVARDDRTNGIDVLSEMDWNTYRKVWGTFGSDLFDFKTSIFHRHRDEFCYAGEWSAYINLSTGEMCQCYCGKKLDNIYADINRKLHFEAVGTHCGIAHCYNGHAFLSLGDIPELNTPTYDKLRNRVDNQGREWLQPGMKKFMSQKLGENNKEYSVGEKKRTDFHYKAARICSMPRIVGSRIKRKLKKQ